MKRDPPRSDLLNTCPILLEAPRLHAREHPQQSHAPVESDESVASIYLPNECHSLNEHYPLRGHRMPKSIVLQKIRNGYRGRTAVNGSSSPRRPLTTNNSLLLFSLH